MDAHTVYRALAIATQHPVILCIKFVTEPAESIM